MSEFVQIHFLTAYPPSNLNRDDLGRPKTAVVGGTQRVRVSSQSLKRSWRTSEQFREAVEGLVGKRTKDVGNYVFEELTERKVDPERAESISQGVAAVFGKREDEKGKGKRARQTRQLAHVAVAEWKRIDGLVEEVAAGKTPSDSDYESLLLRNPGSADIALFGRMLADRPYANVEAAAQVAHAITTHKVAVEEDYFSAVDDLNTRQDDVGAGHIGTSEFASGVFYGYVCINRDLLVRNLNDDEALATKAIEGILRAAATTSPTGKQNSFASRARPSYVLVERGTQQPRTLQAAFVKAVDGTDIMSASIEAIEKTRSNFDKVYGACARDHRSINLLTGEGSFEELVSFASE